jgi:hypothetical protein
MLEVGAVARVGAEAREDVGRAPEEVVHGVTFRERAVACSWI